MPWTQLSTKRERSEIGQNGFSSKSILLDALDILDCTNGPD